MTGRLEWQSKGQAGVDEQEQLERIAELEESKMERMVWDRESRSDEMIAGWACIIVAGAAYAVLIVGVGTVVAFLDWDSFTELPIVLLGALFAAIAGMCLGSLYAGIVGGILMMIAAAIYGSMELRCSTRTVTGFVGGLTGFACTLLIPLATGEASLRGVTSNLEWIIYFLIGPGLSTLFGQIGGAWRISDAWQVDESHRETRRFQFGIRQLLVATTWIAVMLTLARWCGWMEFRFMTVLGFWILFQSASLWIVLRVAASRGGRRLA